MICFNILTWLKNSSLKIDASSSRPHLRREKFSHVAVCVASVQAELLGPWLGPHQAPLRFWRTVDLIVDVFTRVHVETGVEEGAVAEALVCVLVDDAAERKK